MGGVRATAASSSAGTGAATSSSWYHMGWEDRLGSRLEEEVGLASAQRGRAGGRRQLPRVSRAVSPRPHSAAPSPTQLEPPAVQQVVQRTALHFTRTILNPEQERK